LLPNSCSLAKIHSAFQGALRGVRALEELTSHSV
jgi:hypothetical protein